MSAIQFVNFGAFLALWLILLAFVKIRWPHSAAGKVIATVL